MTHGCPTDPKRNEWSFFFFLCCTWMHPMRAKVWRADSGEGGVERDKGQKQRTENRDYGHGQNHIVLSFSVSLFVPIQSSFAVNVILDVHQIKKSLRALLKMRGPKSSSSKQMTVIGVTHWIFKRREKNSTELSHERGEKEPRERHDPLPLVIISLETSSTREEKAQRVSRG